MGVTADSSGFALPISVLGASTSPSFPTATTVTGMVILTYTTGGGSSLGQCVTKQFPVSAS